MFPPLCASSSCLVLPRSGNCGSFGSRLLSKTLDDVGRDITDAYELAWVSLSPALTPEGFSLPSPGSPASLPFQVQQVKLASHPKSPSSSQHEGIREGVSHAAQGVPKAAQIGSKRKRAKGER
jgi:hypothetical protein